MSDYLELPSDLQYLVEKRQKSDRRLRRRRNSAGAISSIKRPSPDRRQNPDRRKSARRKT